MAVIIWILAGIGLPVLFMIYARYLRLNMPVPVKDGQSIESPSMNQGMLVNWASREGLNTNIIWIIVCTILSIAAYSILSIHDYFSPDFSFLTFPIIASLQILIIGRLVQICLPVSLNKYYYRLANTIVIGTAIILFISLLFNRSPQIMDTFTYYFGESDSARLQTVLNIISEIVGTRPYLLLFAISTMVYMALPFDYFANNKLRRMKDIALAAYITLAGYSLFSALYSFISIWEPIAGISWVLLCGLVAVSLSVAASYSTQVKDAFISEVSLWLSNSRIRMFIVGSLLCSYVVFLRPFIYSKADWATSVVEWGLACLIIWRMYNGIQGVISEKYTIQLKYSSWKKHVQQMERKIDNDLSYAIIIQNDFVEHNHKDQLLVYLVTLLHDNSISIDEISDLVHPLTEYQYMKIPLFSSTQKRNSIAAKNKEQRQQIINDIMFTLEEKEINVNGNGH